MPKIYYFLKLLLLNIKRTHFALVNVKLRRSILYKTGPVAQILKTKSCVGLLRHTNSFVAAKLIRDYFKFTRPWKKQIPVVVFGHVFVFTLSCFSFLAINRVGFSYIVDVLRSVLYGSLVRYSDISLLDAVGRTMIVGTRTFTFNNRFDKNTRLRP